MENSSPCSSDSRKVNLKENRRERMTMSETKLPLKPGDNYVYSKTITETDVVLFGAATGDMSRMHFNEQFMQTTKYGTRIVSYGYDHVRFTAPVFFGDTITATYTVTDVDEEAMKTFADIVMVNQKDEVVCVCKHILKFFEVEQ